MVFYTVCSSVTYGQANQGGTNACEEQDKQRSPTKESSDQNFTRNNLIIVVELPKNKDPKTKAMNRECTLLC